VLIHLDISIFFRTFGLQTIKRNSMVVDRNGKQISVGANVKWYDPEEEARDLTRVWQVDDVSEEIVNISDDYSEAEVLPSELEVVE
jgi:hypothetical protein